MTQRAESLVCLTTSAEFGGAETSLLTLLGALRRHDPSLAISVVAPASGPLVERCRALDFDAGVLPYPQPLRALGETSGAGIGSAGSARVRFVAQGLRAAAALPRYITGLRSALGERGATVVHSNGLKAHVAAALAKPAGVRLVWHLHDYVRGRPLSMQLLRRLAHRADAIVANSDSVMADARDVLGSSAPLLRIYNAVDLAAFSPAGPRADVDGLARMPRVDGCLRVGLVATFARWKGHQVFIDAISRMRHRHRVRGYIVGGAVYRTPGSQWTLDELRQAAASHGVADEIGFTGHVADVPSVLRALDVLVHASTAPEPFGMAIAEGMACGRAVIAARSGGAAELFEERLDAIGHEPGNAAQLAEALDELVSDSGLRARLGDAARAAACRKFGPDRMAAEFAKVYFG